MIADAFFVCNLQSLDSSASSRRFCSLINQCCKRFGRVKFICLDTLFVMKKNGLSLHKEWLILFDHIPTCTKQKKPVVWGNFQIVSMKSIWMLGERNCWSKVDYYLFSLETLKWLFSIMQIQWIESWGL